MSLIGYQVMKSDEPRTEGRMAGWLIGWQASSYVGKERIMCGKNVLFDDLMVV